MAPLSREERRREGQRKGQKAAMAGRRCPKCGRGNALRRTDSPGWIGKSCRYCDYDRGQWL